MALTLWHPSGLAHAFSEPCEALLARARPQVVMLHDGPSGLADPLRGGSVPPVLAAIARVHELVPDARVWVGIGSDGLARKRLTGVFTENRAVDRAMRVADVAASAGAECLMWDPEAAWKTPGHSEQTTRLLLLARALIKSVREKHPALVQAHTAYDHPTYHRTYPWSAWCDEEGCDLAFPQVYAAPADPQATAPRGALAARMAAHQRSWSEAVAMGWIRAELPVHPYLQAHHVNWGETVAFGSEAPLCALWSAPTRFDEGGANAVFALCELRRRGKSVREFQADAGLTVDGVCGARTLTALEGR